MTTFQDPPLQSRRAVRQQHERESAQAAVVPTTGPNPTPVAPPAPAEPLTYATQGRPPVPNYDGPAPRSRRTPAPVGEPSPAWAPQYGGATSEPAAPDASSMFAPHPPVQPVVLPSALDTEDAVEHTLTRRELRALRDAHGITTAPEEPAAAHPGTPLAAPSTRLDSAVAEFDQLTGRNTGPVPPVVPAATRGRRAVAKPAEPAGQPSEASAAVPAAPVHPVTPPAPGGPARIAPGALGPVPVLNEPSAPAQAAPPVDGVAVFDALFSAPAVSSTGAPAAPERTVPEQAAPERTAPEQSASQPAPVESVPLEPEVIVAEIVIEPEPAPEPAAASPEPSTTTPTGHWSTQAQFDDETQFGDVQLARNIGATSGAVTTSALVLPSIPTHDFGPIGSGDMVTGSISLPPSLSATGALQLDGPDLDHLLDPGDSQVASTDSQPVRAIRAVSTHTSSRGVINTGKPKGTRGLTALIVAATSMAVIVGALFIVLVATGQL